MSEASSEDREFVRDTLASAAEELHVKRGLAIKKVKQLIREVTSTDY